MNNVKEKAAFYARLKTNKCISFIEKWRIQEKEPEWVRELLKYRIYLQQIGEEKYVFQYAEAETREQLSVCVGHVWDEFLEEPGWQEACQVYEFPIQEYGEQELEVDGLIIGVASGKLKEYVKLHDEQPRIIAELCYQNGFRRSSIFVERLSDGKEYLQQYVEYFGKENPKLYENSVYQEWLRITGECQEPLPGEKFWKSMQLLYNKNDNRRNYR